VTLGLTGDIHHSSLGTGNQRHSDLPEVRVALRDLDRLREAKVKVTFFVTGRTFAEEWDDLAPLCADPLVEIGGHTWSCFEPALWHRAWKKLGGSYNGPAWWQRRDVRRTVEIIRRRTGRTITAWRNHMYMHGPHTDRVLAGEGLRVCSDTVSATATGPRWARPGLLDLPINVLPDHEHLYHAERTPEWVERWRRRYRWSDAFGPQSYFVEEWTERVLDQLRAHEARGALATLIIHPITLYLCDRFRSLERILEFVAARPTVHVSQVHAGAVAEAA
jgi:peptidoglycan/xylan/chitin deacetylase (PgdA/CDA1 family)